MLRMCRILSGRNGAIVTFQFQTWPTTILVVSHDRQFLNTIVTDVFHMHSQRIDMYKGDYELFVRNREDKLKSQQKEYEAQKQYRDHIQVGFWNCT